MDEHENLKQGRSIVNAVRERLSSRKCKACGNALGLHQGIGTGFCDLHQCQRELIAQVSNDKSMREAELYESRQQEMISRSQITINRAARLIGAENLTDVIVATTPYQESPLIDSQKIRHEAFAENLEYIIGQVYCDILDLSGADKLAGEEPKGTSLEAAALPTLSNGIEQARIELEAPHDPILSAACASCKGHCCGLGGDTAFLTTKDLKRWRARHPDASPNDARSAYMNLLPAISNKSTCVFQSVKGCALTREMRSDICNEYQCKSLVKIKQSLADSRTEKVVFISHNFTQVRQYAGWSPETGHLEFPELSVDCEDG